MHSVPSASRSDILCLWGGFPAFQLYIPWLLAPSFISKPEKRGPVSLMGWLSPSLICFVSHFPFCSALPLKNRFIFILFGCVCAHVCVCACACVYACSCLQEPLETKEGGRFPWSWSKGCDLLARVVGRQLRVLRKSSKGSLVLSQLPVLSLLNTYVMGLVRWLRGLRWMLSSLGMWAELAPRNPHGRRRKLTSASCSLTFPCALWHMHLTPNK